MTMFMFMLVFMFMFMFMFMCMCMFLFLFMFMFMFICLCLSRGFNGSVNIPESCDFRSQFDRLNNIFYTIFFFVGIYILNEKV